VSRGVTLLEAMIVLAVIVVLIAFAGPPAYRSYAASRASADAANVLAADLALLSDAAKNSNDDQGATLLVESVNPFSYSGYLGRPAAIDPRTKLGGLLVRRSFPGVTLSGGPIGPATPLLFANNGSAQYETGGTVAPQHATLSFELTSGAGGRSAVVQLNLYTGAVQAVL
jgi:prepilin-type N-terminal cleavage/methylation domain-containing protein